VFNPEDLPENLYNRLQQELKEDVNMYLTDNNKAIQIMAKNTSKKSGIDKL
jgi:hydroxymethylpyrimidine pyrophosphatase-like HAD family hydrolase